MNPGGFHGNQIPRARASNGDVFPLGLLSTAVIFDIIYMINGRVGFQVAAAYMIAAGVLGGLVAAVFGLVNWLGIPREAR